MVFLNTGVSMETQPELGNASLRLFFALWPDDATRAALMRLQAVMQGQLTPYENLHVTLAFLGQQPAALLPDLKRILERLPRTDVTLTLDRVGYFTRKRIAWAGTHKVPENLLRLHQQLANAITALGLATDTPESFKLHVTLARDAAPPPDTAFTPIVWHAGRIALVKSETLSTGVRYEVLASRPIDRDVRVADEAEGENEAAAR
jgi:2'-5' RNA ligase